MAVDRVRRSYEQDPFTDLLFNSLLAITFLFVLTLVFLNPPTKQGIIDPKAEYIITTKWADMSADDVDTWVEDPDGSLLWFRNPAVGLMHLDRDDRGMANDTITVDGREIVNPLNQEVVTLRGIVPGEYVVNVHYYASRSGGALDVDVRVARVNPAFEVIYYATVTLRKQGEQTTAVRFTVNRDGSLTDVNTLFKPIVEVEKL